MIYTRIGYYERKEDGCYDRIAKTQAQAQVDDHDVREHISS
jgi:hypothetical protein